MSGDGSQFATVASGLCQAHMPVPWALGQLPHGDLFQVLRAGLDRASFPSGSGFPEAAGKPAAVFTVVSLGPSGIQGCPQFWVILLMAPFLLLGPTGAGCSLQCPVGGAGLHCASQLHREEISIHPHPPQHFPVHRTQFRAVPPRCGLRAP